MPAYSPELAASYAELWSTAQLIPDRVHLIDQVADRIMALDAWSEYQTVERAIGVPAHVVGIIHQREASGNFRCHLHNGDPLSERTVHVPEGRPPPPAQPPFSWVQSATDALTMPGQKLDKWTDWSAAGIAFILERYNGWGYRKHGINSPYLWGFTTAYDRGLFVADGQWDADAVNGNPGGMAILRVLVDSQSIVLPGATKPTPIAPAVDAPELAATVANFEAAAAALQTRLKATGYYAGAIDSIWGERSQAALVAWKEKHSG
jgi:lysozyme family protein